MKTKYPLIELKFNFCVCRKGVTIVYLEPLSVEIKGGGEILFLSICVNYSNELEPIKYNKVVETEEYKKHSYCLMGTHRLFLCIKDYTSHP